MHIGNILIVCLLGNSVQSRKYLSFSLSYTQMQISLITLSYSCHHVRAIKQQATPLRAKINQSSMFLKPHQSGQHETLISTSLVFSSFSHFLRSLQLLHFVGHKGIHTCSVLPKRSPFIYYLWYDSCRVINIIVNGRKSCYSVNALSALSYDLYYNKSQTSKSLKILKPSQPTVTSSRNR